MPVPQLAWKELTNEEREWKAKSFPEKLEAEAVRYDNGFLVRKKICQSNGEFSSL